MLRAEKGIRKIPPMGVIPGILILVLLLPDLVGIISYLFRFIHVEQSGWLGLRHWHSQVYVFLPRLLLDEKVHIRHSSLSISEIIHIELFKKGNSSVMAFIIHISMLLFMYKLNYVDRIY